MKLLGINNLVVNKPAYESIQQDLKEIGIDLQLTVVPDPGLLRRARHGATDWNVVANNRSRNDPGVLNLHYSPAPRQQLLRDRRTPPADDEIARCSAQLDRTLDPAERDAAASSRAGPPHREVRPGQPRVLPVAGDSPRQYVHGIIFDAQSRNHFVNTWKSK